MNEKTRFYPEHLTWLIPKLFRKPENMIESKYLDKIYSNSFKHGWCVTMNDEIFNKYYKIITGYTHISVNANRKVLYDEFHKNPMICFTDLLHHEMKSNKIPLNGIKTIHQYFQHNEYDSDSIIDDVVGKSDEYTSNVAMFLHTKHKYHQFETIRTRVNKYIGFAEEVKSLCTVNDIFSFEDCTYIQRVINALEEFNKENYSNLNALDVLTAYDHIILVHKLCGLKTHESDDNLDLQQYIINMLDGYCESEKCNILMKHSMRRRERQIDNAEFKNAKEFGDDLTEILVATLRALHCYILHKKQHLFRLKKENARSHFMMSINIVDEKEEAAQDTENIHVNSVLKLNFGISVLNWLDYSDVALFKDFREEIVNNPESTVNEQLFLNFAQECFIKKNGNKHRQYLLEELMSLKIYTDTNSYQSSLRRAFWKSSNKETKKAFYNWAMKLHVASLYHAVPIPRKSMQSKAPAQIYHGLNKVFSIDNAKPKYMGPTSTSLAQSVGHQFTQGAGLLWTIKSSYANKFKFVIGIAVDWISQHKNEEEILLVDQYLPISAVVNFENDLQNNVDHLIVSIKSYKKHIDNPNTFYVILGIVPNDSWIPIIRSH
eukprot:335984_1